MIADLKSAISSNFNLDPWKLQLYFRGDLVKSVSSTLQDLGINNGSSIYVKISGDETNSRNSLTKDDAEAQLDSDAILKITSIAKSIGYGQEQAIAAMMRCSEETSIDDQIKKTLHLLYEGKMQKEAEQQNAAPLSPMNQDSIHSTPVVRSMTTTSPRDRNLDHEGKATDILVSILSDHDHLTIGKLEREFNIANGSISWDIAFKHTLGDMRSFIRNHNRFYILDEWKRAFHVALIRDPEDVPFVGSESEESVQTERIQKMEKLQTANQRATANGARNGQKTRISTKSRDRCNGLNGFVAELMEDEDDSDSPQNVKKKLTFDIMDSDNGKDGDDTFAVSGEPTELDTRLLKPLSLKRGSKLSELLSYASSTSNVDAHFMKMAQITTSKRVIILSDLDSESKLKSIPMRDEAEVMIWDTRCGDLVNREMMRRTHCVKVKVWLEIDDDNDSLPRLLWCPLEYTLHDVSRIISSTLTMEQRQNIETAGRFKNSNTQEIYYEMSKKLSDLDFSNCSATLKLIPLQPHQIPGDGDIILHCRVKQDGIDIRTATQHDVIIAKNVEFNVAKRAIASTIGIDPNEYCLHPVREQSSWRMGKKMTKIGAKSEKVILTKVNSKQWTTLDVWVEVDSDFKWKNIRREHVVDETKVFAREIVGDRLTIPVGDKLDAYKRFSAQRITKLPMLKSTRGDHAKKKVRDHLVRDLIFSDTVTPDDFRLSIKTYSYNRPRFIILNSKCSIGSKDGLCILEFHDRPRSEDHYESGVDKVPKLVFIHQMISNKALYARYGPRYEIDLVEKDQTIKYNEFKTCIRSNVGWAGDIPDEFMVIAARDLDHQWKVLKDERIEHRSKTKITLNCKFNHRHIIGICDSRRVLLSGDDRISGRHFETLFDRQLRSGNPPQLQKPLIIPAFNNPDTLRPQNEEKKEEDSKSTNDGLAFSAVNDAMKALQQPIELMTAKAHGMEDHEGAILIIKEEPVDDRIVVDDDTKGTAASDCVPDDYDSEATESE